MNDKIQITELRDLAILHIANLRQTIDHLEQKLRQLPETNPCLNTMGELQRQPQIIDAYVIRLATLLRNQNEIV